VNKCFLSWGIVISAVLALALHSSAPSAGINTADWGITEFIQHLQSAGLHFRVISTRKDGKLAHSAFLTQAEPASWSTLQCMNRNVENIDQWHGSVWIEHLSAAGETEWYVGDWGRHGCQIDRFVLFGDADLVQQIHKALNR
jgi:hypothetical protein